MTWEQYCSRAEARGLTRRDALLKRTKRNLLNKETDSLSFHKVLIDEEERQVTIIDSDNLNEKRIISLPGEDLKCGALVEWMNNYWLITERDANNEVNTRAKLRQCNYLLKWVDEEHIIHKQWCVVEDGTKSKRFPHRVTCVKKYLLNCWEILKANSTTT